MHDNDTYRAYINAPSLRPEAVLGNVNLGRDGEDQVPVIATFLSTPLAVCFDEPSGREECSGESRSPFETRQWSGPDRGLKPTAIASSNLA
jgi:hypothetical protein